MGKIISIICLFFSIALLHGQNAQSIYKKCLPSIVKIFIVRNHGMVAVGTGFFIGEKTIVTCYHVVNNASSIEIQTSDGKNYTPDSVISSNEKTDLIKFTVKEKSKFWLNLSPRLPEVGENTYIIGNPELADFSLSNGIVSAIRIINANQVIQTTAPCSSGNSGSPVLDEKALVIGVVFSVKFIGQNLNFAATSLDVINIKDDKSIKYLSPVVKSISKFEMDSIINQAHIYFKANDYKNTLKTILPVINLGDSAQSLEFTEMIGDSYLNTENYSSASDYYDHLFNFITKIKNPNKDYYWIFAQSLQKQSICYYILGDKDAAINYLAKAAEICKSGLAYDTVRKQQYNLLIQQVYFSDACYKYSENKIYEACLSWKLAKHYGYKKDDFDFDNICK